MLEELGGKYEDVKREYDNATEWIENNSRLNYETENNKAREVWKGL
jgi:hypothetical protein